MAVKSLKNFFDAVDFDEVGDAMDLWWNTIQNSFEFDAISKKKEFNAVVISPPVPIGANSDEMETFFAAVQGEVNDTLPKFIFRARLKDIDSHHVFWPDPCDPRFLEDVGGQENAIDWITKHMKVIAIGANEVPKVGDTVRVKLDKEGIYTSSPETAIMVGLVTSLDSINRSALAFAESQECRTSLGKVFENYTPESTYAPLPDKVASSGAEFMKVLRDSGHFNTSDFTDEFLAGLAANAQAESNFNATIGGDPVSAYKEGSKSRKIAEANSIDGKCSWGLFQINFCNGAGNQFAKENRFIYDDSNPLTAERKRDLRDNYILDKDKYLKFISSKMKTISALNDIRADAAISAKQAGQFIATYFERCEGCKKTDDFTFPSGWSESSKTANETIARGNNAEQFLSKFKTTPSPTTTTTTSPTGPSPTP